MTKPAHTELSPPAEERTSAHPGWWTVLAVLVAAWLGVPWTLPVAAAVPWLFFRRRNRTDRLAPTLRWALAVGAAGLAIVALASHRAIRTIPAGPETATAVHTWLAGNGDAPPSLASMAVWAALFAAGTVASRGMVGGVVLANALLVSAVQAGTILAQSSNVFHACWIAFPVWSLLLLGGMALLIEPVAGWSEARVWRIRRGDAAVFSKRRWIVGLAMIAAGFATRILLAPVITDLARRVTTR